jgi:hypothetical protein
MIGLLLVGELRPLSNCFGPGGGCLPFVKLRGPVGGTAPILFTGVAESAVGEDCGV